MLVAELLKQEHSVTVLHRRPKHDLGRRVKNIVADRNDAQAMKAALAGKKFDVVFDNVYDWERGTTAGHVEATVRAVGGQSAALHFHVERGGVRRRPESSRRRRAGAGRRARAVRPQQSHERARAVPPAPAHRIAGGDAAPAVYLWPGSNPFYREAFFWDRLRASRSIILPGDGRRLMQFVYVKDLVRARLRAMDEPAAVGHAFNIANARPLSQTEVVEAFAKACQEAGEIRAHPARIYSARGRASHGSEAVFRRVFRHAADHAGDGESAARAEIQAHRFRRGLKETYNWYLRHNGFPKPDYTFEDQLLATAPVLPPAKV